MNLAVIASVCPAISLGQNPDWRAITSLNQTEKMAVTDTDEVWAISTGGLYHYQNGSVQNTYTTVDGLYRLNPTEIEYLPNNQQLLIGYADGMLDLFDPQTQTFRQISDIARVTTFPSKVIRDLFYEDTSQRVYVATDFGIVIIDTERFLVLDSVTKVGSFERGIAVFDVSVNSGTIYAATSAGFAVASLDNNLKDPASWQNYDESNSPMQSGIRSFERVGELIFAEDGQSNYVYSDENWEMTDLLPDETLPVSSFEQSSSGNVLSGVSGSKLILIRAGNTADWQIEIFPTTALRAESAYYQDEANQEGALQGGANQDGALQGGAKQGGSLRGGALRGGALRGETSSVDGTTTPSSEARIFFGTLDSGLGILHPSSGTFNYPIPSGPRLNFFDGMQFDDDVLISGTTQRSQRNDLLDNTKGYVIYKDGEWLNYHRQNNEQLDQASYRQAFTTAITNQHYYFGSWGRGIVRHHKETGEITIYNSANSALRGWAADDDRFVVISGLETDQEDRVWATSRFATNPLYVQTPGENTWTAFPKPDAMQFGDEAVALFVDSRGQKWVTLQSVTTAGRGLMVLEAGLPAEGENHQSVKLTDDAGGGNLPDNNVNAIIEDLNGEIWVGTERGIAKYLFPEFIITGTSLERTAQWLINEDPNAGSAFLLRDVQVRTMAINPANQKWVGTVNNGVWLLNSEGSRVLQHFTTANSPLLSDAITDIEVNSKTGEVYISTDVGLMVYHDRPVEPQPAMNRLKVYPNPFHAASDDQVVIEGLTDQTTVRILTPDGHLIQSFENRGGTAVWDGKDFNGNTTASGVYLIVALDRDGNDRGIGKLVIIR